MSARLSKSSPKNVYGSAWSFPQPGRSENGTFLLVVWIVVYAPLIERTLNVIPILAAFAWITGTMRLSSARVSATISTLLHCDIVHLPALSGSYFDCFISAAAFVASPESFGVLYGSYSARPFWYMTGGAMCRAIEPITGPPHAFRSACLSMM